MADDLETLKKELYMNFNNATYWAKQANKNTYEGMAAAGSLYGAAAQAAQAIIELERRPSQKSPKASP